jgi:hypothetical protein
MQVKNMSSDRSQTLRDFPITAPPAGMSGRFGE